MQICNFAEQPLTQKVNVGRSKLAGKMQIFNRAERPLTQKVNVGRSKLW